MASGKRASMREGPLAALFRKTEEDAKLASAEVDMTLFDRPTKALTERLAVQHGPQAMRARGARCPAPKVQAGARAHLVAELRLDLDGRAGGYDGGVAGRALRRRRFRHEQDGRGEHHAPAPRRGDAVGPQLEPRPEVERQQLLVALLLVVVNSGVATKRAVETIKEDVQWAKQQMR